MRKEIKTLTFFTAKKKDKEKASTMVFRDDRIKPWPRWQVPVFALRRKGLCEI
jgi:hypothetical protein